MGSEIIGISDNTAKSKILNFSFCRSLFQLVRCSPSSRAEIGPGRAPSGPLVGGLEGGHGSGDLRGRWARGDGGDEETRTPDPLLAKEMLYQLSYVPQSRGGNGGRFWTRTRDLCLIRAVL